MCLLSLEQQSVTKLVSLPHPERPDLRPFQVQVEGARGGWLIVACHAVLVKVPVSVPVPLNNTPPTEADEALSLAGAPSGAAWEMWLGQTLRQLFRELFAGLG